MSELHGNLCNSFKDIQHWKMLRNSDPSHMYKCTRNINQREKDLYVLISIVFATLGLHLGFSAKLKIHLPRWSHKVAIKCSWNHPPVHPPINPPTNPPTQPWHQLKIPVGCLEKLKIRSFQFMCGVLPSQHIFPPPIKKVCAVSPLSVDIFSVHCPSPPISVSLPHSALSLILNIVSN